MQSLKKYELIDWLKCEYLDFTKNEIHNSLYFSTSIYWKKKTCENRAIIPREWSTIATSVTNNHAQIYQLLRVEA